MENVLPPGGKYMPEFPTSFSHGWWWTCGVGVGVCKPGCLSHFLGLKMSVWGDISKADICANKHLGAWLLHVLGETCCQLPAACVGVFPSPHRIILSPRTFVVLHEQLSWRDRGGHCWSGTRAEAERWEAWYTRCVRRWEDLSSTEGHAESQGDGDRAWMGSGKSHLSSKHTPPLPLQFLVLE